MENLTNNNNVSVTKLKTPRLEMEIEEKPCEKSSTKKRKKPTKCYTYLLLTIGLSSLAIGFLLIKFPLYNLMMDEKLNMRRGLPPFEWWKNPIPEVKLKMYVFTVENPDEFLNGTDDKLRIKEIGPIVYQEHLAHKDVVFHPENSTMSYTSIRTPIFKPEENEPGILNKTILVPNLTTLGVAAFLHDANFFVKFGLNVLFNKYDSKAFLNTTVYNFLWNMTSEVISTAKSIVPFMVPLENIGVMHNIYTDYSDRVNVKMGAKNGHRNFFRLNLFNYRETVPGYLPEKGDCYASIVNSTEGAIYPQYLTKDSVLEYWRKSLCRKVPLYFEQEVERDALALYKFTLPANVYDRLDNLTADCYKGVNSVLPDGLTDISKCFMGFPIAMSNPHFYHRRGDWADYVEGFTPNKDDHESFITLEPTMAVPFEQCARSQSNLVVDKLTSYPEELLKFSEKIVPLFWIEYCQRSLTPPIVFTVQFIVNVLPSLQYFLMTFFICFGLVTTIVSAFWITNMRKSPTNLLLLRANGALERETFLRKDGVKQADVS